MSTTDLAADSAADPGADPGADSAGDSAGVPAGDGTAGAGASGAPGAADAVGSGDPHTGASEAERSAVRSLLRLWPYVRPVRARFFGAAVVAIVASSMGLVIPLVLKWIVDGPVAARDTEGVWLGGALLLGVGIAEAALFGFRRWLVARPLASVEASMRADLYGHLQRLPVAFHDRWASGQLLSRATADLQLLRMFLVFPLTFLVVNGTTITVGCAIMFAQDWTLGLVVLVPLLPLAVLCSFFEARYFFAARRAQDQIGDLTTVVEEAVLGIRIVKGFGRHQSQARAFRSLSERLLGTEMRKARLLAGILAFITTLPELALGAALVLGTMRVADGSLSAGTLVAFLSTALALRWPVESMGFLLAMSNEAATATDRFFEVMDAPLPAEGESVPGPAPSRNRGSAPDPGPQSPWGHLPRPKGCGGGLAKQARPATEDARPQAVHGGTEAEPTHGDTEAKPTHGGTEAEALEETGWGGDGERPPARTAGMRFEGVTFRYPDAPRDSAATLDGVDLDIRPGETMALVGATGSGKTTLTALVPRLHEATEGRILLDGVDITALPRAELRALVAVAFEEPTLFSATVRENVLMGSGEAAPDDAALHRALRIAQADGFVAALPEGVDTEVGEQGLSLSGGQRQRLALARAVVGAPRFLVLDDPLSALDVHTEAAVEAALREVLATTTALVVAHRPSTVLLADRVALLSGGRVAAVGTHHELLHGSAEYASLMSGEAYADDTSERSLQA